MTLMELARKLKAALHRERGTTPRTPDVPDPEPPLAAEAAMATEPPRVEAPAPAFPYTIVRVHFDKWPLVCGSAIQNLPCNVVCAECGRKHFLPLHVYQGFFHEPRAPGIRLAFLCAGCRPELLPIPSGSESHE